MFLSDLLYRVFGFLNFYILLLILCCHNNYFLTLGENKEWCFTCEFESLILKAKEGNAPVSPIGIISHIKSIGSHLGYGREEDAHEFLR